jgi:hypothetical protein
MSRAKKALPLLGAAVLSLGLLTPAGAAPAVGTVSLIATHLDNPRGLAFGPEGRLYVAVAGHGGGDCPAAASTPEGGQACFGRSGGVVKLVQGRPVLVARGLASVADPDGVAAEGPSALVRTANGWQVVMGESPQATPPGLIPANRATSLAQQGRLLAISDTNQQSVLANVGGDDYVWTSHHKSLVPGQFPDANPFSAIRYQGHTFVIDSGANLLTEVVGSRTVPRAFFPNPPVSDSVPTCVTQGPDGALYVGELTGGGNRAGSARIWRVVLNQTPKVWRKGLTNVTGCGFDSRGNFYATELQTTPLSPGPTSDPRGAVIKLAPNGTKTVLGYGHLFYPVGMVIKGNALYVSNWSILPGTVHHKGDPTGQIVRVQL